MESLPKDSGSSKKLCLLSAVRIKPCPGATNVMTDEDKWDEGVVGVEGATFGPFSSIIARDEQQSEV